MIIEVAILVIIAVVGIGLSILAAYVDVMLGIFVFLFTMCTYVYFPRFLFRNRLVYKIEKEIRKENGKYKVLYQHKSLVWTNHAYYPTEEEAKEAILSHAKSLQPVKNIEIGQYTVCGGMLVRRRDTAP